MKTLRKYANMAFLLISVTAIVPAYANLEDKYVILKERIIQQSEKPEMLKKVFQLSETAFLALGITAVLFYTGIGFHIVYKGLTGGKYPVYKIQAQQP